ncbi:hypothetical protein TetV_657 [Tetraselmis virus 1]|uniref:Protein kinase n=1 Tax=Tetraselmis virus 1 TaxID=2060617 RepID=A0A2P0VPE3_9VIRU|nr:hypothetical protein QJ968_gp397 [Tetraselmis virus 1]AUF82739.1 hypothetical protein TetV_657 [Tetraselmis virus 1]
MKSFFVLSFIQRVYLLLASDRVLSNKDSLNAIKVIVKGVQGNASNSGLTSKDMELILLFLRLPSHGTRTEKYDRIDCVPLSRGAMRVVNEHAREYNLFMNLTKKLTGKIGNSIPQAMEMITKVLGFDFDGSPDSLEAVLDYFNVPYNACENQYRLSTLLEDFLTHGMRIKSTHPHVEFGLETYDINVFYKGFECEYKKTGPGGDTFIYHCVEENVYIKVGRFSRGKIDICNETNVYHLLHKDVAAIAPSYVCSGSSLDKSFSFLVIDSLPSEYISVCDYMTKYPLTSQVLDQLQCGIVTLCRKYGRTFRHGDHHLGNIFVNVNDPKDMRPIDTGYSCVCEGSYVTFDASGSNIYYKHAISMLKSRKLSVSYLTKSEFLKMFDLLMPLVYVVGHEKAMKIFNKEFAAYPKTHHLTNDRSREDMFMYIWAAINGC